MTFNVAACNSDAPLVSKINHMTTALDILTDVLST
jgi:hypothetical protein